MFCSPEELKKALFATKLGKLSEIENALLASIRNSGLDSNSTNATYVAKLVTT